METSGQLYLSPPQLRLQSQLAFPIVRRETQASAGAGGAGGQLGCQVGSGCHRPPRQGGSAGGSAVGGLLPTLPRDTWWGKGGAAHLCRESVRVVFPRGCVWWVPSAGGGDGLCRQRGTCGRQEAAVGTRAALAMLTCPSANSPLISQCAGWAPMMVSGPPPPPSLLPREQEASEGHASRHPNWHPLPVRSEGLWRRAPAGAAAQGAVRDTPPQRRWRWRGIGSPSPSAGAVCCRE